MTETLVKMKQPYELVAGLILSFSLLVILKIHLLPVLLSGMLVYELVHSFSPVMTYGNFKGHRVRVAIVALMALFIVAALAFLVLGGFLYFRHSADNLPTLLQKMAEIIETSMSHLPDWAVSYLPPDVEGMKVLAVEWLRRHAGELKMVGAEAVRTLVHVLVGMVIGSLVALNKLDRPVADRPLSSAFVNQVARLGSAFHRVVFAQLRISAINTFFTLIYIAVLLPLFAAKLPFSKTLIAITFITGLLPVIGNLVSNTVIIIVSFSVSFHVAVSSMLFLVVIHKLEYFLNARIVGSQIKSRSWEILLAMVVMEALFGLPGVVAAPIYYAYFKDFLISMELI